MQLQRYSFFNRTKDFIEKFNLKPPFFMINQRKQPTYTDFFPLKKYKAIAHTIMYRR